MSDLSSKNKPVVTESLSEASARYAASIQDHAA